MEIRVTFKEETPPDPEKYDVTLGEGLSSLDSLTNLEAGTKVNITITVPEDKEVYEFKVDGAVIDLAGALTYELTVSKNHNVTVSFKNKLYTVTLGPNLNSGDPLTNLLAGSKVNITIDVPTGKEVGEFKVDGTPIDLGGLLTYELTISGNHNVTVSFKPITYTLNYSINDGLFTFQQQYAYNEQVSDDYVASEVGNQAWYYNGALVTFPFDYSYTENITLTATVAPLAESKFEYESITSTSVRITKINNTADDKVVIIPETIAGKM